MKKFIKKFPISLYFILLIVIFIILAAQQIYIKDIWTNNNTDKIVYLTFDDGPDPVNTPKILNILDQLNIKATFFLIGEKVDEYPQVARQIAESGHEIGSHGYSHPEYNYMGNLEVLKDIRLAQSAIFKATEKNPTLFRPPFGQVDKAITAILMGEHLNLVLWSLDSKDFRKNADRDRIIEVIDSKINNGSIIILHEISDATVKALPEIIKRIEKKGFSMEILSVRLF